MNTASRKTVTCNARAPKTTCPPRRAFVASDARRRGQVCVVEETNTTASGGVLSTLATLASVDNTLMPDT